MLNMIKPNHAIRQQMIDSVPLVSSDNKYQVTRVFKNGDCVTLGFKYKQSALQVKHLSESMIHVRSVIFADYIHE